MRIASALHDASPEPDGAPLFPAVALERDGSLYGVTELARAFGPRYAAIADAVDFHQTVISLRADALHELDLRLKGGERPSSARILPGSFTWLAPCDTERAALVACTAHAPPGGPVPREPSFRLGSARGLYGHEATVPLAADDAPPHAEGSLAVVLGDDLFRATAAEAEQAILGFTLMLEWNGGYAAQLGPVLVTREEAGRADRLRTQMRVGGAPLPACDAATRSFSPAESIAWVSHFVPLRAGDVISAGRLHGDSTLAASAPLAHGTRVDFAIERIGKLTGRSARGPEMCAWRRDA